eukprot:7998097-Lingulodinium_polyedra.AAC.1
MAGSVRGGPGSLTDGGRMAGSWRARGTMSVPCAYHERTTSVPCAYHERTMGMPRAFHEHAMSGP